VTIDYTALLGLTAGIQVVKADFDWDRDGGELYEKAIQTGIIPADSLILGSTCLTKTAFTFDTSGYFAFRMDGVNVGLPALAESVIINWVPNNVASYRTTKDTPIIGFVDTSACLSGVAQLWLYYLPT
jgi:hypothetical protein